MDTLDRYLIREFFILFFILLVGLGTLYLGIDFFSKFWNLRIPTDRALLLYIYKIPSALQQFVPVACLMATLLVLSNMSRQNEVLALYTGGVGTLRIASTFIAAVSLICTVSFLTFDSISPVFARKQILVKQGIDPSEELSSTYNPIGFWYRSGRLIYRVGRFDPRSNTMDDVNVYVLSPKYEILQRIWAKTANYHDKEGWILKTGFLVMYPPDTNYPMTARFKEKKGIIPEEPSDFRSFRVQEETIRLKELRKFIARNKSYGLDTTGSQVNYHERMALVFTPLIFVLIGIPFSTKPLRTQSHAKSIGFCFLIVFIYLLLFRLALSVGKGGHVPPYIAGWFPNCLFLIYATYKLIRHRA